MKNMLKEIINTLWLKQIPFAAYRFPNEEKVTIVVQRNPVVQKFYLDKIESIKGFVIAPFNCAISKKAFLLNPDLIVDQYTPLKEIEKLPSANSKGHIQPKNRIWSKKNYIKKAEMLINELKDNKLQKVVLSRVIEQKLEKKLDPGNMFKLMNEKFHHSFNYIFHLPLTASWIGASPEIFFRIKATVAETVSLAGTKHISDIRWTLKERHEQAVVTDFIRHQLENLGIMNYSLSSPETVIAGQLAHLSSKFSIPIMDLKDKMARLINRLHPTPAVCGLPQKEAFDYISRTEDHDRKFYTGFLGPWGINQCSELYVNLRCAEISEQMIHVFVGGGFTSASEAASEWEETVHKSETLLSVAENF